MGPRSGSSVVHCVLFYYLLYGYDLWVLPGTHIGGVHRKDTTGTHYYGYLEVPIEGRNQLTPGEVEVPTVRGFHRGYWSSPMVSCSILSVGYIIARDGTGCQAFLWGSFDFFGGGEEEGAIRYTWRAVRSNSRHRRGRNRWWHCLERERREILWRRKPY